MNKKVSNQINPNKLLLSKWTAVNPTNKEKHFIVTRVIRNELDEISSCVIEAVINNRECEVSWQELRDKNKWYYGWQ